jgi:hypothetical protein
MFRNSKLKIAALCVFSFGLGTSINASATDGLCWNRCWSELTVCLSNSPQNAHWMCYATFNACEWDCGGMVP